MCCAWDKLIETRRINGLGVQKGFRKAAPGVVAVPSKVRPNIVTTNEGGGLITKVMCSNTHGFLMPGLLTQYRA